eukprot:scaffold18815_cov116-Isochrysis_galbana.AAC.6
MCAGPGGSRRGIAAPLPGARSGGRRARMAACAQYCASCYNSEHPQGRGGMIYGIPPHGRWISFTKTKESCRVPRRLGVSASFPHWNVVGVADGWVRVGLGTAGAGAHATAILVGRRGDAPVHSGACRVHSRCEGAWAST